MNRKEFFNELAPSWDERFYTPELVTHLRYKLVPLFRVQPGSKILDVGAGTGGIVPFLLEALGPGGRIWSIDFAERMVEIGRKKFENEKRVIFEVQSVETLPYEDQFFDQIIAFGVFPHLEDKARALREMNRVLKTQRTLVIAHALSSAEIRNHHKDATPVSKDFLPEREEMERLLNRAGFQMVRLIDEPKCYFCEALKIQSAR
jgi:ubiquinone/menaquinone biosynthesis C-methylase UbiE